jgi:hypothetical protein
MKDLTLVGVDNIIKVMDINKGEILKSMGGLDLENMKNLIVWNHIINQ